ncbi:CocE/NonD family hydrolase C-terminal non-catalytic domain-containing protein [Streptomyces sp. NPDC090045]|uniref:CocE/NonD family hydrolase C-terminal non-catalytic domain-containing protein n=1 Tax=Streptomyces sp. NPDC090045 TaxID=3365927 RepID=UPI0038204551
MGRRWWSTHGTDGRRASGSRGAPTTYLTASTADRQDGGLGTAPETDGSASSPPANSPKPPRWTPSSRPARRSGTAPRRRTRPASSTAGTSSVWTSGPLQGARRIRGVPELTLTVRSSAAATTLVAYLFDVGADDTAHIITHEPLTLPELSPGCPSSTAPGQTRVRVRVRVHRVRSLLVATARVRPDGEKPTARSSE